MARVNVGTSHVAEVSTKAAKYPRTLCLNAIFTSTREMETYPLSSLEENMDPSAPHRPPECVFLGTH